MNITPATVDLPLAQLELVGCSVHAIGILERACGLYVGDVLAKDRAWLLEQKGMGPASLEEFLLALEKWQVRVDG